MSFPGPQGIKPTIFKVPYSRYISSNFSRRFDLFLHLFNLLMIIQPPDDRLSYTTHVVTNLWAVAHTWPVFFQTHPWKRRTRTSTVTPKPLIYSFFSFSTNSKTDHTFSRYIPYIFSDVSTSFLTSFFTVVPKGFTTGSKVHVAVKLDLSIHLKL